MSQNQTLDLRHILAQLYWAHSTVSWQASQLHTDICLHTGKKDSFVWGPLGALPLKGTPLPGESDSIEQSFVSRQVVTPTESSPLIQFSWNFKCIRQNFISYFLLIFPSSPAHWIVSHKARVCVCVCVTTVRSMRHMTGPLSTAVTWSLIWLCICVRFLSWGHSEPCLCLCFLMALSGWWCVTYMGGVCVCVCVLRGCGWDGGEAWRKSETKKFHLATPVQNSMADLH